uniref:Uncharacterized protein n=1 Tax=Anopheles christyi TaxID=43041 RepID=A0A182JUI1_9DIPT
MSARDPHQMDVTRPPPQIDDSFPHPTLLERLRLTDEQSVQHFLTSFPRANTPGVRDTRSSPIAINISTYREELGEALRVLQTLKNSKLVLEELDQDDPQWKEEVERTDQLKSILLNTLEALEDIKRKELLKRKLIIRQKKRAWQKRRNERLKTNRTAQQASREERLREIANWEAEWKDRLNQERIAREELQMKTIILTDVRRRKARAKRVLNRFEKSDRLRQQKQSTKFTDPELEESFRKRMDTLVTEWKSKLNECVKEERKLKEELSRQTAGNAGRRKENRWRKVLFGTAVQGTWPAGHQRQDDWWHELVSVRRAWDKFCLPFDSNNGGSVAPSNWILPPEHPLPEWAVYREGEKTIPEKATRETVLAAAVLLPPPDPPVLPRLLAAVVPPKELVPLSSGAAEPPLPPPPPPTDCLKSAILLLDASESFSLGNVEGARLFSPPPVPPVTASESFEFSSPLTCPTSVSTGVLDFVATDCCCVTPWRAAGVLEKRFPDETFSRSCPVGLVVDESLAVVLCAFVFPGTPLSAPPPPARSRPTPVADELAFDDSRFEEDVLEIFPVAPSLTVSSDGGAFTELLLLLDEEEDDFVLPGGAISPFDTPTGAEPEPNALLADIFCCGSPLPPPDWPPIGPGPVEAPVLLLLGTVGLLLLLLMLLLLFVLLVLDRFGLAVTGRFIDAEEETPESDCELLFGPPPPMPLLPLEPDNVAEDEELDDFLPSLFGLECLCFEEEDVLSFSFDVEFADEDIDDVVEELGSAALDDSDDDFCPDGTFPLPVPPTGDVLLLDGSFGSGDTLLPLPLLPLDLCGNGDPNSSANCPFVSSTDEDDFDLDFLSWEELPLEDRSVPPPPPPPPPLFPCPPRLLL